MPKKGQKYRFFVWDDSLSTPDYVKVGETREKSITRSKELLDRSSDNAPTDASFVGGLREGEVTISGLYAPTDSGQTLIEGVFDSDTATKMKLEGNSSGDPKIEFDGHIEDWSRQFTINELSSFELTIRTDGDINETTVA